ncbi:MAG: hypothetical protein NVS1B7_3750 [Candidatus Saccharimonadales bacterium]
MSRDILSRMSNIQPTHKKRRADYYNHPEHSYPKFWEGREYEQASEEIALTTLLKNKHFKSAADIGGGYGRLCIFLENYADHVTLAEPSQKQLDVAKEFLQGHPNISLVLTQADDLQLADNSMDLLTMIRVMHHIPEPTTEFRELARVLTDDGYLILELANNAHGRNRIKYALKGKKIPSEPVDIRSQQYRNEDNIAFVNHNPKTIVKQLAHAGLKVEKILSVSNLRSTTLKRVVPRSMMLSLEKIMQPTLARTFFGPSVFFLVKKAK